MVVILLCLKQPPHPVFIDVQSAILLIHDESDVISPLTQSESMAAALKKAGTRVQLTVWRGEDNNTPKNDVLLVRYPVIFDYCAHRFVSMNAGVATGFYMPALTRRNQTRPRISCKVPSYAVLTGIHGGSSSNTFFTPIDTSLLERSEFSPKL